MAIAPMGRLAPTNHDVVLYAVPGSLDDRDKSLLKQWREKGTTVIVFSSPASGVVQAPLFWTIASERAKFVP